MYTTHLAIWRLLLGPLNLSHFVEDQNDPSTSQILPSWPSVQWWGRAPPVRSIPPVQRRSADESCAGTERTRHTLAGYICSRHERLADMASIRKTGTRLDSRGPHRARILSAYD